MPLSEVAIRRVGALVALAAASALMLVLFPAAVAADGSHVVVVMSAMLVVVFQLGCAAVLLSPARRAVDQLARRGAQAAREQLRLAGFIGIVFYAVYVLGGVRKEAPVLAKEVAVVRGFLLFLVFLVALWTVNLSILTVAKGVASGSRPAPTPTPAPAVEQEVDGGEVDYMMPVSACVHDSKV